MQFNTEVVGATKSTDITHACAFVLNDGTCELHVYFQNNMVDNNVQGDEYWLEDFKALLSNIGISEDALAELYFMHVEHNSDDFAKLEAGEQFLQEWHALNGAISNLSCSLL